MDLVKKPQYARLLDDPLLCFTKQVVEMFVEVLYVSTEFLKVPAHMFHIGMHMLQFCFHMGNEFFCLCHLLTSLCL